MNKNHKDTKVAEDTKDELLRRANEVSYQAIGAAMEVHKLMGPGFLEHAYEEAFCLELNNRGIKFSRQTRVEVEYKMEIVDNHRLDLVVDDCLVVELKAVDSYAPIHIAQVISYLRATHFRLGLLINFNVPILKYGIKRIIL